MFFFSFFVIVIVVVVVILTIPKTHQRNLGLHIFYLNNFFFSVTQNLLITFLNMSSNQGQLYMGQQNENLNYLYNLINELKKQIELNQTKKDSILERVDTLSSIINRGPTKTQENISNDIALFDRFLSQKSTSLLPKKIIVNEHANSDYEVYLKNQNELLNELLLQRRKITSHSINILKQNEDDLSSVIDHLRNDFMHNQKNVLNDIRRQFQNVHMNYEDLEFEGYMTNIENLQVVFDIISLYKIIMSILGNDSPCS